MPSQHKHPPIRFRPPEQEREWLIAYAKHTGQPINAVLAKALARFHAEVDRGGNDRGEDR